MAPSRARRSGLDRRQHRERARPQIEHSQDGSRKGCRGPGRALGGAAGHGKLGRLPALAQLTLERGQDCLVIGRRVDGPLGRQVADAGVGAVVARSAAAEAREEGSIGGALFGNQRRRAKRDACRRWITWVQGWRA